MYVMTASGNDVYDFGFGFGLTRVERRAARQVKRAGVALPDPVPIIGTGASRIERRAERKQRRGVIPPGPAPVPVMEVLSPRRERKLARKERRGVLTPGGGPVFCIKGKCSAGYCESDGMCCPSDPRMMAPCVPVPPGPGPGPTPPPVPGTGVCATSEYGCSNTAPTLGACLQCCSHNFQGRTRRACKRECDRCFTAGGPPSPGPGPGPSPVPTQSCGYECVGPGDTGDMVCEYVCHDYGGAIAPAASPSDVYAPPSGGFAPGGGTPYVEPEAPPEEEQTFLQKYGLWLAIGGAAAVVIAVSSRKGRR